MSQEISKNRLSQILQDAKSEKPFVSTFIARFELVDIVEQLLKQQEYIEQLKIEMLEASSLGEELHIMQRQRDEARQALLITERALANDTTVPAWHKQRARAELIAEGKIQP